MDVLLHKIHPYWGHFHLESHQSSLSDEFCYCLCALKQQRMFYTATGFISVCPWPGLLAMSRSSKHPAQTLPCFCYLNLRCNESVFFTSNYKAFRVFKPWWHIAKYDLQQGNNNKSPLKIYSFLHVVKTPRTFIISPTRKLFPQYALMNLEMVSTPRVLRKQNYCFSLLIDWGNLQAFILLVPGIFSGTKINATFSS